MIGAGEIGLGLFHDAAEGLEDPALRIDGGTYAPIDRDSAQIAPPGDTDALEIAPGIAAKMRAGGFQRERRARVGAGYGGEHQGNIFHSARQRAFHIQRRPRHGSWPGGNPSGRRTHANHTAETGRVAQGSAEVSAIRDGQHAAGERNGRTAARASTGFRTVPRVDGGAEDLVVSLRAGAKFRRVGFAQTNGSGGAEPFHQQGILPRDVIAKDARAERGADAAHRLQVLVGDGEAVKRSRNFMVGLSFVSRRGAG